MSKPMRSESLDIVVTVQHPAHVHFFRNIIDELEQAGHNVTVFARKKDITERLLQQFEIPYTILAGPAESLPGLAKVQLTYEARLYAKARRIRPDIMMAIGGVAVSHVSKLVDATSIIFIDNEDVLSNYVSWPFADVVCTPERFESDYGSSHVRYSGYHEVAYLHPDVFEPKPNLLEDYGVNPKETFSVVRLVGWNAHHDVGKSGFSKTDRQTLLSTLAEYGDVYLTSESELPPKFEQYQLPVPPHLIHHLLYYADLYVGDSQTMATEAAILGTPAVRSNSFAGTDDMSNFIELEQEYDLLNSITDGEQAISTAEQLLQDPSTKALWSKKRAKLFDDKINVNQFVLNLIYESVGRVRKREEVLT
ncbi:DUF354 domain-containing protein [Natrialbaceae archaeon A-CW3]